MKKLASLAAAGAMLFGLAVPALANGFDGFGGVVVINRGWAYQDTDADADANTGAQKGGDIEDNDGAVVTGDALAVAGATSVANQFSTGVLSDCGCFAFVWNRGGARQYTDADADANTGAQKGGDIEDNDGAVVTGSTMAVSAASAWANIFTTEVVSLGLLD